MLQLSVAMKNALLDALETQGGTLPYLDIFNGALPATPATANAGTLIASGQLPSDWMSNASSGAKAKTGTWTLTGQAGAGGGTVGQYWRLFASDHTTCIAQGSCGPTTNPTQAATTVTSGSASVTLSGSNALIVPGMLVTGTGIQAGTYVSSISGTALVLTQNALVTGSPTLTFQADMTLDNTSIANAQSVTVNTFTLTAGN